MSSFATLNRVVSVVESTLGGRLLQARLEYGSRLNPPRAVTQIEVAKEVGVSGVAVGGWEADRNEPGLDKIRALAKLYGVRVGWLVAGELPMRYEDEGDQGAQQPPGSHTPPNGTPAPHPRGVRLSDPSTGVYRHRPDAAKKRRRGGG